MHLGSNKLMSVFIVFYLITGLHHTRSFLSVNSYFPFQQNNRNVFCIFISRYIEGSPQYLYFQITYLHYKRMFLIRSDFKVGLTIQLHSADFLSKIIQITQLRS